MKLTSKSLLAQLLLVVALIGLLAALAIPQTAAAGIQNSILNGGTNNVPAATTNNYQAVITPFTFATTTKGWIGLTAACSGASTATYDATFDTSVDGIKWQTNAFQIRLTGNGTASVTTNYAIPAGFLAPQVRLATWANTNAATTVLTNLNVSAFSGNGF